MSNMLMFLLLLFLAGDVEKNPGPMGTPQTHRHFGSFPKTTSTDFMVEKPNYNSM
jgi:hypothetical protein